LAVDWVISTREEQVIKDRHWLYILRELRIFDAFKVVVRPIVGMTRREAGCLANECSISLERSATHILDHYRDEAAVIRRVTKTFSHFAEKFTALAKASSFVVYGDPDGEARAILDGFGVVYMNRFDDFAK
jgi:quinol monooxygenase YgiN